jgi:hypothetical protein
MKMFLSDASTFLPPVFVPMRALRKSVDTVVLTVLFVLGSAFIALGGLVRHGRRPAGDVGLAEVIERAMIVLALGALAGVWLFRGRY